MPSEKSLKNLEEKRNIKRDDLFWEEKFIEFTQLRLTGMTQGRAIEYLQLPERTFYRRYKIWIKERIEEKRKQYDEHCEMMLNSIQLIYKTSMAKKDMHTALSSIEKYQEIGEKLGIFPKSAQDININAPNIFESLSSIVKIIEAKK